MKKIKLNEYDDDIPKNYTGIVECTNGPKYWFLNGELYRVEGPSIQWIDGTKYWCLNDTIHREDGPAIEYANGDKEYWLNGKKLNEEKIEYLIKLGYPESTAIKLTKLFQTKNLI